MWSYPNPHRDGATNKEICDLLVVYEDHVLIFSDKRVSWSDQKPPLVAWRRWYKKAIEESAKQIAGAENFILDNPDRVFTDRKCTQHLPVPLPSRDKAIVHRIIVANGAAEACQKHFKSLRGSLIRSSNLVGEDHNVENGEAVGPFEVGYPLTKGQVFHILDEANLHIVMGLRDTVTDFTQYLSDKEELLSRMHVRACSEEDLLCMYLSNTGDDNRHYFCKEERAALSVGEGFAEQWLTSERYRDQVEQDEVSKVWDDLIDHLAENLQAEPSQPSKETRSNMARALQLMAGQNRTQRRILGEALLTLLQKPLLGGRNARIILGQPDEPTFVFLVLDHPPNVSEDDYIQLRHDMLHGYALVAKDKATASPVVAMATNAPRGVGEMTSLAYYEAGPVEGDMKAEMEALADALKIMQESEFFHTRAEEFPRPTQSRIRKLAYMRGERVRLPWNEERRCFCGSGRKYKNCCLKAGIPPPYWEPKKR